MKFRGTFSQAVRAVVAAARVADEHVEGSGRVALLGACDVVRAREEAPVFARCGCCGARDRLDDDGDRTRAFDGGVVDAECRVCREAGVTAVAACRRCRVAEVMTTSSPQRFSGRAGEMTCNACGGRARMRRHLVEVDQPMTPDEWRRAQSAATLIRRAVDDRQRAADEERAAMTRERRPATLRR